MAINSRRLSDAVSAGKGKASDTSLEIENIRWVEAYTWKERVTEFCEATDPAGHYESASSSGHKDYQDRLRCIALRRDGRSKSEISAALGRSLKFVQAWWEKEPREVPKPSGVHDHLAPEFWRDLQIVRGYGREPGIYEDLVLTTEWCQSKGTTPGFKDGGGSRLWYDKEGRMKNNSKQYGKDGLQVGKSPQLDSIIQRLLVEQGIDDRLLRRPSVLWYPDGSSMAIPHRHECWTALLSFGAPRILTIDEQPVLLRHGDLIVFGTQRHGVPRMCNDGSGFQDYGGRVSVVFFFMPSGMQAQGAEPWKAILDESESGAMSRATIAMLHDVKLGGAAQREMLSTGHVAAEVQRLVDLGFPADQATAALQATAFDLPRAAEALLSGCGSALITADGGAAATVVFSEAAEAARLRARLAEIDAERNSPSTYSRDAGISWEEQAIMERLQDLERCIGFNSNASLLRAQFAQFDEMLDAEDAQNWDGRGDLMARADRREHLQFDKQDPVTLYSLGCGRLQERRLFELLSMHAVRVLYDLRARIGPSTEPLSASTLATSCKARGIVFKQVALGRESAYGIVKHLREDEGRNTLSELVWHAKRRHTAFLGFDEDWRCDTRVATAASLSAAGHTVWHILSDGRLERHPDGYEVPQALASEETRLKSLEQQRCAGFHSQKGKSSASRSSEAVALKLSQPQVETDAAAQLRGARDQPELQRIQQRLARLYRESEAPDAKAGLGPKVINAGKWVLNEAAQHNSQKDAQKGLDASTVESPLAASQNSSSSQSWRSKAFEESTWCNEPLMVECQGCGVAMPWAELETYDGRCASCASEHNVGTAEFDMTSHCRALCNVDMEGADMGCRGLRSGDVPGHGIEQISSKSGRWRRRHQLVRNV